MHLSASLAQTNSAEQTTTPRRVGGGVSGRMRTPNLTTEMISAQPQTTKTSPFCNPHTMCSQSTLGKGTKKGDTHKQQEPGNLVPTLVQRGWHSRQVAGSRSDSRCGRSSRLSAVTSIHTVFVFGATSSIVVGTSPGRVDTSGHERVATSATYLGFAGSTAEIRRHLVLGLGRRSAVRDRRSLAIQGRASRPALVGVTPSPGALKLRTEWLRSATSANVVQNAPPIPFASLRSFPNWGRVASPYRHSSNSRGPRTPGLPPRRGFRSGPSVGLGRRSAVVPCRADGRARLAGFIEGERVTVTPCVIPRDILENVPTVW
mgnify:FL=1